MSEVAGRRNASDARQPDLVYPVRGGDNEELRYSLRSLDANANGLFRKVWIVGRDLPTWLVNVEIIDAGAAGGKQADIRAKVWAAAVDGCVASRIVLITDDLFLVEPIACWEAFHMGPTSEYVARLAEQGTTTANSGWLRNVVSTAEWMAEQGYGDILVRQGHRPLLWDRKKLAEALATYPVDRRLDVVGLYDIAGAAGEGRKAGNAKIRNNSEYRERMTILDHPWRSSNDRGFREDLIGRHIRSMFPDPCRYEAA